MCQINVHLTEIPVSLWNLGHFSKFKTRSPEPRLAEKNVCKENKHQSLKRHIEEGCQKCNFFSKGNPKPIHISDSSLWQALLSTLRTDQWRRPTECLLVVAYLPVGGQMKYTGQLSGSQVSGRKIKWAAGDVSTGYPTVPFLASTVLSCVLNTHPRTHREVWLSASLHSSRWRPLQTDN